MLAAQCQDDLVARAPAHLAVHVRHVPEESAAQVSGDEARIGRAQREVAVEHGAVCRELDLGRHVLAGTRVVDGGVRGAAARLQPADLGDIQPGVLEVRLHEGGLQIGAFERRLHVDGRLAGHVGAPQQAESVEEVCRHHALGGQVRRLAVVREIVLPDEVHG